VQALDGAWTAQEADAPLPELTTVRTLAIGVSQERSRELKVWAHSILPEGLSGPLPVRMRVEGDAGAQALDLDRSGGQVVVPIGDGPIRVELAFPAVGD
jgi:hypothetical protein